MTDSQYQEESLAEGQEELTVGGEQLLLLPEGEPLDAIISDVGKIMAPDYKNPAIQKPRYVLKFQVTAEIDGKGQVYSKWVTPSLHEKAKLREIAEAILGKLEKGVKFDPALLKGNSCRIILKNKAKGDFTFQNVDKVLGPSKV